MFPIYNAEEFAGKLPGPKLNLRWYALNNPLNKSSFFSISYFSQQPTYISSKLFKENKEDDDGDRKNPEVNK